MDGSIILAGYTSGTWVGTRGTEEDGVQNFAAMAVNEEGLQLWSYQVKESGAPFAEYVAVIPRDAVLLMDADSLEFAWLGGRIEPLQSVPRLNIFLYHAYEIGLARAGVCCE